MVTSCKAGSQANSLPWPHAGMERAVGTPTMLTHAHRMPVGLVAWEMLLPWGRASRFAPTCTHLL